MSFINLVVVILYYLLIFSWKKGSQDLLQVLVGRKISKVIVNKPLIQYNVRGSNTYFPMIEDVLFVSFE